MVTWPGPSRIRVLVAGFRQIGSIGKTCPTHLYFLQTWSSSGSSQKHGMYLAHSTKTNSCCFILSHISFMLAIFLLARLGSVKATCGEICRERVSNIKIGNFTHPTHTTSSNKFSLFIWLFDTNPLLWKCYNKSTFLLLKLIKTLDYSKRPRCRVHTTEC